MFKKILSLFILIFLIASCGTFGDVKRGITGAKQDTSDEFLIKKKDPLTLPPNFENLPSPDERAVAVEELSVFEKKIVNTDEEFSSTSSSTEENILRKIQSK